MDFKDNFWLFFDWCRIMMWRETSSDGLLLEIMLEVVVVAAAVLAWVPVEEVAQAGVMKVGVGGVTDQETETTGLIEMIGLIDV
jgi:hypothetical protein